MRALKCIIAILICELVGNIGTFFTLPNIPTWYAHLTKPPLTPPNVVFGPVWTTLFVLMGVSLFLLWEAKHSKEHRQALDLFFVQMVLNVLWSVLFFGTHQLSAAVFEVVVFWFAILGTIVASFRVSKAASWVLVPYLVWVAFASYLTVGVWLLNR